VVELETIHRIVKMIADDHYLSEKVTGKKILTTEDCNELGRNLLRMNVLNVQARYGRRHPQPPHCENYEHLPMWGREMQQYKSLCCFLYQSCDYSLIRRTKLFRALEDIRCKMAIRILEETEEFQNCRWA